MLNICFSEEVKNTLQCAIQDGYLIASDTVCIPDDLSLGDISNIKRIESRISATKLLREVDHVAEMDFQFYYRAPSSLPSPGAVSLNAALSTYSFLPHM